ncbi:MAG TPA: cell division protein FtsZ [Candidatus Alistipes intestinigallinarum]|uniref:Cell division protein FtsZ n=1 Tax=Candidatus Alistipes intestinigallinarum TaxID=2838440 RepID=A0A9D1Z1B4_9BACT|nr:cell division protein FtsZ [Candidatus Alistipes intestinigallinarum]
MTDELMSEIKVPRTNGSIIMVVGVGGAGGNAVNHMWNLGIRGVTFMVCNTDQQALDKSPVEQKIRLGAEGLGAGNDPENGRRAAVETLPEIRQALEAAGTKMLFITAGMGGGTGTGASPVIAKLAKEMGLLTVAIVTSPLAVEGKIRYEQAFRGIEELRQNTDSLLIINNENILEIYGRLSLKQAFGKADDILASAAKGIAEIITVESDLVNVDFADVSKVMRDSGRAHMAVATAEGDNRAEAVAEASLRSPLLDHNLISGAKNILLNISVSNADGLMYEEVVQILEYIQAHASVQDEQGVIHNANIIWGTSEKPQLGNAIELVVVATGFEGDLPGSGMKPVMPTPRIIEPVPAPESVTTPPVLEPIKPVAPKPAQRVPEQVMLGAKPTRYSNIEALLARPAYQTRNSKFIVQMPGGRKEVLKEDSADPAQQHGAPKGGSLFD